MSEDGKVPDCFEWFDNLDPSCRRCIVKAACTQKQVESRPPCFSEMYDGSDPECVKCLDNSQCQEESDKMAAPKIRIKRSPAAVAAVEQVAEVQEPEPEFVEEDTMAATNGDESPYDEMSVEDLREELNSRGLDSSGRRSQMVSRLEEDDAKPVTKPAPKPAPKPVAKPAAKPVAVSKPVAVAPKVAPTPIPSKPVTAVSGNGEAQSVLSMTVQEVFEIMRSGESLALVKEDKNTMILSLVPTDAVSKNLAKAAAPSKKLRGDAYWSEVLSPEYYSWYYKDAGNGKPWGDMTAEEKEEFVTGLGIEYETSDDPRMNALHQVQALLAKMGIEKYKEQYQTSAARDALKG